MDPNSLARSDAFFIITSVAIVLIALVACVTLIYFVGILRSVRRTAKKIEQVTEIVGKDLADFRQHIKNRGFTASVIGNLVKNWRGKKTSRKTKDN